MPQNSLPQQADNFELKFSGHDTFTLRQLWIPKLINLLIQREKSGKTISFSDEDTMIDLGVGKNMVSSMRFWGNATGFIDENDCITMLGKTLIGSSAGEGFDPYAESSNTTWLAHWNLASESKNLSVVWMMFNLVNTTGFSRNDLLEELLRLARTHGKKIATNSLKRDVEVCLRSYSAINESTFSKKINEDSVEPLFSELSLLYPKTRDTFELRRSERPTLKNEIFAYAVLDFWEKKFSSNAALNFSSIAYDIGSPGRIFKLDDDSLMERLYELEETTHGLLLWTDQAGIKTLTRRGDALINPLKVKYELLIPQAYQNA